jgi:hypothetical protein
MIRIPDLELAVCSDCEHHFVRPPARYHLPCGRCGARMVITAVYADHRDIAALPLAQATTQAASAA